MNKTGSYLLPFFFSRVVLSSLKPKWYFSKEMEEAVILFLVQEPQKTNFYIITDRVYSLLACISHN